MATAFYPRNTWTGHAPSWSHMGRVSDVFIHHTVTGRPATFDPGICRQIEAGHRAQGGVACFYHRLHFPDGTVAEGRPWGVKGGATINNNSTSYALSAVGNYEHDNVTNQLLEAMADEIVWGVLNGFIDRNFRVRGHRDVFATACPGANLYGHANNGFASVGAWANVKLEQIGLPPGAPAPTPRCQDTCSKRVLRRGSSGVCVKTLQNTLRNKGFDPGPSDGQFGPKTDNAVRCFQGAAGLSVDGVVGPQTWGALLV